MTPLKNASISKSNFKACSSQISEEQTGEGALVVVHPGKYRPQSITDKNGEGKNPGSRAHRGQEVKEGPMSVLRTGTSYVPNRYHNRSYSFEKGISPDRQGVEPNAAYTSLSSDSTSSSDSS